ncbi:MAG TPA: hypothetical protein VKV35_10220 [Streptosporangiaceae bacterium]|nr:hypothetical protein [Streptosporangiaceae bacterium]
MTIPASSWPRNVPEQATPTAGQGARGLSLIAAGLGCSRNIFL